LLKLRGEVGVLRRQLDELAEKNRALQNANTAMLGSNTNLPAPQVHIKSRFIEVSQDDNKSHGFDWYLGNFVNGSVAGNGGSAPSLTVPVSAVNPLGAFPGNTASSIVSPSATFTGILTDTNFRVAIHALEQRGGTETLGEPSATTTSGHQVQMRATQVISVVTNFCLQEINGTSVTVPQTENVEAGPVLDVIPRVLPDGYTIELPVIASVVEFLGYAQSTNTTPAYNSAGQEIDLPTASPQFRVQSTTNSVNLFDNQTLVFGLKDNQVPTDAALAELDGSKSNSLNRQTLVFITATIVDAAGNRVHENASYTNIPPQAAEQ
jgi:type II secretory pathway component GspD/PulD (secretin)